MTSATGTKARPDNLHCTICPKCDWVIKLQPPGIQEQACCPRCRHPVAEGANHRLSDTIAWALAALVMLALTLNFDFLGFETQGIGHTMSFLDAMQALNGYGYPALALLFILTTVLLPGLFLLGAIYMTVAALQSRSLPLAISTARMVHAIRHWMMCDVLLVGILVSLVKIVTLAQISLGPSFVVFCVFCLLLLKTMNVIEWTQLWPRIAGPAATLPGLQSGRNGRAQHTALCTTCGSPIATQRTNRCSRCGKRHWLQRVSRLQLTWALVLTALLLYIPANIYPIMTTQTLVGSTDQTIAEGVLHLIALGSWPIALVIFFASIVVPLTKIATLAWLCLCGQYGLHHSSHTQTRLYHIVEFIGRWSMIDVFVVSVLAALVQAGSLMSIQPGPAAFSFAAVVIITMLAAETFDPRLLWCDSPKEHG